MRVLLLALLFSVFTLSWFFWLNKEKRNLAGFSKVEMEYAETLLEGEEEVDPDSDTGPVYEDTLSIPGYDYKNTVDEVLEDSRITDYKRALTEQISANKTQRVKEELAKRIIERNRKEGYEIVLDEKFNLVSSKEIKSKKPEQASEEEKKTSKKTSSKKPKSD